MKVVIAGATGFLGQPLVRSLLAAGHEVVVLTRGRSGSARVSPDVPDGARAALWDARSAGAWTGELRGTEAVVNLAGANIGAKRWSDDRKRELLSSRIESTGALVSAMMALPVEERPQSLINASGIDYYGDRGDEIVTEESAAGKSFLAQLCVQWEAAAREAEALGVRVVRMRTSVVLGKGAMALERLAMPFRFFVGGPIGSGTQWFAWIHLDDAVGLYRFALENAAVAGPLNLVAPDVRRGKDVAREVGRALSRPSWAPAPAFALKLALGEQAELVLHGRHATPQKALQLGYQFVFPRLPEALQDALG
jgi:uncharacterized protein